MLPTWIFSPHSTRHSHSISQQSCNRGLAPFRVTPYRGYGMKDRFFGAHEFPAREETVKLPSERSFGLVFAGFFLLLGVLSLWRAGNSWQLWWPLAALFALAAYAAPRLLAPLNRLWAAFGRLLHAIVSPVILAILFYACITPIGVLMRLAGRDPLRRKFEPAAKSYWIAREPPGPTPETFRHQF
jgi:hypothetical protein